VGFSSRRLREKIVAVFELAIEIAKRPERLGDDMERAQPWDFASIVHRGMHRSTGVLECWSSRSVRVIDFSAGQRTSHEGAFETSIPNLDTGYAAYWPQRDRRW
jgi:hypothetical protein